MKSKRITIPAIALALLSLMTILGVHIAKADENGTYPLIVQKLSNRFDLNTEEVQQVFDEARKERQQEMQAHFEERLDQAVSEGKITEEQKEAIMAKKDEMKANRKEFRGLMPEEKQEKAQSHRQEMKTWAEENGINLSLLPMLLGGHHNAFGGPHFGR